MLVGGNLPEEQMNAIAERTIAELGDHGKQKKAKKLIKECFI